MSILSDIQELIQNDVISQDTADKIQAYYRSKTGKSQNRLFAVFGVLGSLLVSLGVILILAHNWDELSRSVKTFIAFIPLVIGQVLCGFVLLKKQESGTWRESGATFLFVAIASSISLIAQIYNISGDFNKFLLTWMLLGLPLVYLMRSSVVSLFYIIGITIYARDSFFYWGGGSYTEPYLYWLLLLLIVTHYIFLIKKNSASNFVIFHHWLVPLSVTITLGSIAESHGELLWIAYMSLFGLFYLIGNSSFLKEQKPKNSGYLVLGSLGTIWILLALSFDWFWEGLQEHNLKYLQFSDVVTSPEFIGSGIISLLAAVLFYRHRKNTPLAEMKPIEPVFILFVVTFVIGIFNPNVVVIDNILVLGIGVWTIRNGAKSDHLGVLNFGLLIITALVVCRFFDTHLTFVIRGLLFISVGLGFFLTNYRMLKKRKEA